MHVSEFLDALGFAVDIEVVVTPLPELIPVAFEAFGRLAFQSAERGIQAPDLRLGYEQVNVLWHEEVTMHVDAVTTARSV